MSWLKFIGNCELEEESAACGKNGGCDSAIDIKHSFITLSWAPSWPFLSDPMITPLFNCGKVFWEILVLGAHWLFSLVGVAVLMQIFNNVQKKDVDNL